MDRQALTTPEPTLSEDQQTTVNASRRDWIVVFLLVISVMINYIDRSNLSISATLVQHQLALSPLQIGTLLSAFFWTYALLQICGLAGWLSDRLPVGLVMAGGYLLWSGATMLIGLTSSFVSMCLALLLLGAGESVAYPCYSRIFAQLPQQQRGRANAFIDAGTKLGPAAGAFVGGIILVHSGWRMLFLLLGAGGLLWLPPWLRFMPRPRPQRSAEETGPAPSLFRILRLRCAWGTYLGHFCGNYFYYFLLAWVPIYLVHEQGLSISAMSRLASALFLLIAAATTLTGWISDRLIASGISATRVRLSVAAGGLTIASVLAALAFVHRNPPLSLAIFVVAALGYGAFASQHWAISQTLAGPVIAGRWSSLQNGVANLSGIIAPWLTGLFVQLYGSVRLSFAVTGAVALVGALAWALLVRRVEPVGWQAADNNRLEPHA